MDCYVKTNFFADFFHQLCEGRSQMNTIDFKLTKEFVYEKCVDRVESRRLSETPIKPQIAICRDDKSLVSYFFNCKTGVNNKYLVTKRLLNYYDKDTDEYYGAVPVFGFKNEHEVLWGDTQEFQNNLFSILSLLIKDILNSEYERKNILENSLCDNIIYAKYSTFRNIKKQYDLSLLKTFGIWDYMVEYQAMNDYLEIAINHLYNKNLFKESFMEIFLSFTKKYNNYTHIDNRLCKDFLPDFLSLLDKYKPSSNSMGLRVKILIETDIIKAIDQLEAFSSNSDFCSTQEFQLNKEIIRASSQYIVELEKFARHSYEIGTYIYGW